MTNQRQTGHIRLVVALEIILILALLGGIWASRGYTKFLQTPLPVPEAGVRFEVAPGMSLRAVARELQAQGVVTQPAWLILLARSSGAATRIRVGEYELRGEIRPVDLLNKLTSGAVVQYTLTLVEGWTFQQVMAAVAADPILRQTLTGMDDAAVMARLGYAGEHPEGRFFPDTYHFPRGTSDVEFLQRAYRNMAARLQQEWDARAENLPLQEPYEALILASIIERETGVPYERAEIAGVFIRRLKKGMRLQTDPTVIYGLGKDFDGDLRRSDLRTDNPYNTYTRDGLPPTPIAMPGGAAIHAALHPAPGDSLFFVSRGDGSHVFSRTLREHNNAVSNFQLGRTPAAAPETKVEAASESKVE